VPHVIPCQLIDPKQEVDPERKEDQVNGSDKEYPYDSLYSQVGIPIYRKNQNNPHGVIDYSTSGVYFMSNELSQDLPLPAHLKMKV
jgi:hypothetical protein